MIPAKNKTWNPWTPAEDDLLVSLMQAREISDCSMREVAAQIPGRTDSGCGCHYLALMRKKHGKPVRPGGKMPPARKVNGRIRHTREDLQLRNRPPPEPLFYASPYGELLGEPAIGRSALDKKRAGGSVDEPSRNPWSSLDRLCEGYRAPITLAGVGVSS